MGERGGGGEGEGVITWLGIIWEGERGNKCGVRRWEWKSIVEEFLLVGGFSRKSYS